MMTLYLHSLPALCSPRYTKEQMHQIYIALIFQLSITETQVGALACHSEQCEHYVTTHAIDTKPPDQDPFI